MELDPGQFDNDWRAPGKFIHSENSERRRTRPLALEQRGTRAQRVSCHLKR